MPTTGRRVHRTAASRGARTQAIGSGFCALRLGCSSLAGLLRWDSGSGAASSTTIGGGHTGGLAVSLAMLTAGVADLRAAQHRAAQAAAARRAAEHLRGAVANHRSRSGPREVRVRASDVARMDFPARPTVVQQASPERQTSRRAPGSGLPRAARDRRQGSPRSVARAHRGVAPRPDFCHLITARLDGKLMTNDLQASSKIWKLACDLRELVGGTRLELVTSSVSGKRSPN
jgi:hypothetical protein